MSPNHHWSRLLVLTATSALVISACGPSQVQLGNGAAIANAPAVALAKLASSAPSRDISAAALPVISDDDPRYLWQVLTGAGGGVLLTRLDGTDQVRLATDVPGVHKHANWSPDGEHVVFIDDVTETMWIANLDGSASRQLPGCDHDGCDYPAWSPDGTKIAFSRYLSAPDVIGPTSVGIEVLDLASGRSSQVIRLERPLLADVPRWSPDGRRLVFGVDRMDDEANETGAAIAVVDAKGGRPTYLTDFDRYLYAPDWNTRTGEIVAGTSLREFAPNVDLGKETWDVWGLRPDGSHLRQITHASPRQRFAGAKWTPDGARILAFDFKHYTSVEIDPVTGHASKIHGPVNTTSPKLRPTS
ncbi:MAG: hypothetical protein ABIO16_14200 [Nocardioides sp.]